MESSSCDTCVFRKMQKRCERHKRDICNVCKCLDCMTPLEEIEYFKKKINDSYANIHYYEYEITEIRKQHNISDNEK